MGSSDCMGASTQRLLGASMTCAGKTVHSLKVSMLTQAQQSQKHGPGLHQAEGT